MTWPEVCFASNLFSLGDGAVCPSLPEGEPVWMMLDPQADSNLKSQLANLLASLDDGQDVELSGATCDTSKGPVYVHAGAKVEPSVHLIGPCYVGDGAVLRHGAYIRENSWICANSVVGHCSEVKHSVLLPGAKAPHFNYIGDSILGAGVNIGAGVKLSNFRNDGKTINLRIGEEKISSGLRKFGAILGDGCLLGCNTVTNPGVVLGKDSMSLANSTITGVHPQNSRHS